MGDTSFLDAPALIGGEHFQTAFEIKAQKALGEEVKKKSISQRCLFITQEDFHNSCVLN